MVTTVPSDRNRVINTFSVPVQTRFGLMYRRSVYIRHPTKVLEQVQVWLDSLLFMWQRALYGYSVGDWWSIDTYLLSWLPEAVRKYKYGMGFPGEEALGVENEADALRVWHGILDQIADGLEAGRDYLDMTDFDQFYKGTPEEVESMYESYFEGDGKRLDFDKEAFDKLQSERLDQFNESWALLGKWLFSCWD